MPFTIRHPKLLGQSRIFAFLPSQQLLCWRICASTDSSVAVHGSVALSLTQAPIRRQPNNYSLTHARRQASRQQAGGAVRPARVSLRDLHHCADYGVRSRNRLLGQPKGPVEMLDAGQHRNLELASPDWGVGHAVGLPVWAPQFCMTTATTPFRIRPLPAKGPGELRTPTPNFSCSTPSPSSAASPSPSANSDSREAACRPFRPSTVPSPTCKPAPLASPSPLRLESRTSYSSVASSTPERVQNQSINLRAEPRTNNTSPVCAYSGLWTTVRHVCRFPMPWFGDPARGGHPWLDRA